MNTLRRATLAGWDLDPIRAPLEALADPKGELASIRRLAFLKHPDREAAIAALQQGRFRPGGREQSRWPCPDGHDGPVLHGRPPTHGGDAAGGGQRNPTTMGQ